MVLFADISGSTALYERYGDQRAQDLVVRCLDELASVCARHGGIVVKTVGDEIMCRFPLVEDAARAASGFNAAIARVKNDGMGPVSVRVGFHFGEVIDDQGDLFGDAVNVAARMTTIAKARQVITTGESIERLPQELAGSVRRYDQISVKGRQSPVTVYELVWDRADSTSILTGANLADFLESSRLRLDFDGERHVLLPDSPALHLGRATSCEVVVDSPLVSRLHATIEYRRGKFVIADQSTNGTYVRGEDGNEVYLRREDLPLRGHGVIGLGQAVRRNKDSVIEFVCD